MIRLAPLVPIELAAALALLLVLLEVVPLCRRSEASPGRRVLVALLWSAGVLLALLPLLGASVERPLASAPAGLVLVDDSRSMATEDALLGRSRFEAAQEIARGLEHDGWAVASLSGGLGLAPTASSTSLGAAIERARSRPGAPAALVLVTDGAPTTDEDAVALAREAHAAGTEIHTVLVGRTDRAPPPRLASVSLDAPPRVETGARLAVHASALVEGLEGAPVTFELALDGEPVGSVPAFGSAQPAVREAAFSVPIGAAGGHELRLSVKAGDHAASARRFVVARDRVLRVALIDLPARWEHRWLRRALEENPSVALARVELYAPEHSSDADDRALAAIASADVVILGDVPRRLLGASVGAALVHAVDEERKGLIVLGGRQAFGGALDLGLAALLPTDVGED
ncbi:MAG TPA: vWA domain-containing protein, partial [Planctomycetota bacterium]|nr:vWA domain-containing protein [Planctomycetota bacterium]